MSTANALEFRVAVGDPSGPNSVTAKIWTLRSKSDVYIAVRELVGIVKVSLHESGECLSGVTAEMARNDQPFIARLGGSRHQHRWTRRTHLGSQTAAAAHICFPSSELRAWRKNDVASSAIEWLPPPAEGRSVIVHCVFSGSLRDDSRWPGRENGLKFLRSTLLPNGEKFWIVWEDLETTPVERSIIRQTHEKRAAEPMVEFTKPIEAGDGGARAVAFGINKEFEGYFIVDVALD